MTVFGQTNNRKGEQTTETTIKLMTIIDDSIEVILFESNDFTVKTSLRVFKKSLNKWLKGHPHLKEDRKLLNLVIKQAESDTIINALMIAREHNLISRLNYRTADLLEKGDCLILNKKQKKKSVISEIKVQTYSHRGGPLSGDGGRRFFINGILLFAVQDWIS